MNRNRTTCHRAASTNARWIREKAHQLLKGALGLDHLEGAVLPTS
jgi:hypothetical protein